MVRLFKGTCEAVRAMHTYRAPLKSSTNGAPSSSHSQAGQSSSSRKKPPKAKAQPRADGYGAPMGQDDEDDEHGDDDHDDDHFPSPEGDGDGGYSYESGASVPLMTRNRVEEQGDVVFDGDQELADTHANEHDGECEVVPYAHRDIKPGLALILIIPKAENLIVLSRNVMVADDGVTPILMDFGSTVKARIDVQTRSQALYQQVSLLLPTTPPSTSSYLSTGPRSRTEHDGLPCSRALRRQNRTNDRRESRHLVPRLHTLRSRLL